MMNGYAWRFHFNIPLNAISEKYEILEKLFKNSIFRYIFFKKNVDNTLYQFNSVRIMSTSQWWNFAGV